MKISVFIRGFLTVLLTMAMTMEVASADAEAQKSGKSEKRQQSFDYRDFQKIRIAGVYEITVRNGLDYSVKISGREYALARANVRVENNTLYLEHAKSKKKRGRYGKTVRAVISLPDLHEIHISGVVDGTVSDINTDQFKVDVSGIGDLRLTGRCSQLIAELSGVGDVNARGLLCKSADVSVSGVGDASVYASESLKAHVSGIGDLTCYGSPKMVRKNRNFFSSIRVH